VGCTPDATFTWSATPASRIARESVDGHLLIFRCIAHHARDSHRR
jgi:hypothetical protein